jgi:hypothetical protein
MDKRLREQIPIFENNAQFFFKLGKILHRYKLKM